MLSFLFYAHGALGVGSDETVAVGVSKWKASRDGERNILVGGCRGLSERRLICSVSRNTAKIAWFKLESVFRMCVVGSPCQ